jgi:hypothetical protein
VSRNAGTGATIHDMSGHLDSIDPRHHAWKPGPPICAVLVCGRVANAGFLRDFCVDHAVEVQRFRSWLIREFEGDLAALTTARDDVE